MWLMAPTVHVLLVLTLAEAFSELTALIRSILH